MDKNTVSREGNRAKIELTSDLVASVVQDLRPQFKSLSDKGITELTIDLSQVSAIDSMGIGLLIAVYNSMLSRNGQVFLTNASVEIKELLREMRIDKRLTVA